MYRNFFGFKERPFKLVPNPAYLFLSQSHEEALAHLTYALSQGDGFVEITGEVGTGKTTLCRSFLEGLDEKTEAAYIFNPKLDAVQLLKAINDEFGIRSDQDNAKDLIDALNAFLIEKKAEGKQVILVIDEAQNLSAEVLEQLRLLSNLETTTSKLLQIILMGQPELGEMLDSHELRQLGQRITLSCHLKPLNYKETKAYIQHRIQIASKRPGVKFTNEAFRAIYRYSGGIPRRINIVCDRALLTAYGLNQQKITGSIAAASIKELAARGDVKRISFRGERRTALLFGLLVALLLVIFFYPGELSMNGLFRSAEPKRAPKRVSKPIERPEIASPAPPEVQAEEEEKAALMSTGKGEDPGPVKAEAEVVVEEKEAMEAKAAEAPSVKSLADILKGIDSGTSRRFALKAAIELWQDGSEINPFLDHVEDDRLFFRFAAKQNGLLIQRIDKDFNLIKVLNLPAILEFYPPGSISVKYLTLFKLGEREMYFKVGERAEVIRVNPAEVESLWTGSAYVPWKNFLAYTGTIPLNAPRESIITLKMLIHDIGFDEIEINPIYDESVKNAIMEIQKKHGVEVDGIVGPLTKIILYNEKESLKIPHLIEKKTTLSSPEAAEPRVAKEEAEQ